MVGWTSAIDEMDIYDLTVVRLSLYRICFRAGR